MEMFKFEFDGFSIVVFAAFEGTCSRSSWLMVNGTSKKRGVSMDAPLKGAVRSTRGRGV